MTHRLSVVLVAATLCVTAVTVWAQTTVKLLGK